MPKRLALAALLAFALVLVVAAGRARSGDEPRPLPAVSSPPASPLQPLTPDPEPKPPPPPPQPRTRDPEPKPPPANEIVARFTTRYPAGEPRVTNIRRAAELLNGRRLRPGETFSMNAALGERTLERGFAPAPSIVDNRFVDSVGGGISQVATALYNAAFFAGLDLVQHTAHSIYIERYPLGREATISWGGPELVFRNDWPAPLHMRLRATDTTLTVRFLSAGLGRRVETETSDRIASGGDGFTVEYTRRVFRYDELVRNERFRTRYVR